MIQSEVWKDIIGFEGSYKISNQGRVKSYRKYKEGYILSNVPNTNGYYKVVLQYKGTNKTALIHVEMAISFLGHTPDGGRYIVVDHINNIKTDNRLINLQIISKQENCTKDMKGYVKKVFVITNRNPKTKTSKPKRKRIIYDNHAYASREYVGVSRCANSNKWKASMIIRGKTVDLGTYSKAKDASIAVQESMMV